MRQAPPQIPPFLLAGQQGWDRYIGDVTVDAPLAFSANGVTSGTKTAPMVATIVFKDAPGTVLNRYDGEYVLVIGILAAP